MKNIKLKRVVLEPDVLQDQIMQVQNFMVFCLIQLNLQFTKSPIK